MDDVTEIVIDEANRSVDGAVASARLSCDALYLKQIDYETIVLTVYRGTKILCFTITSEREDIWITHGDGEFTEEQTEQEN